MIYLFSVKLADAGRLERAEDSPHLVSALDDDWPWQNSADGDGEGNRGMKTVENVVGCLGGAVSRERWRLGERRGRRFALELGGG